DSVCSFKGRRALNQYLERFAEPEIRKLPSGSWKHAVVIPAYGEGSSMFSLLESLVRAANQAKVIVVIVINHREDSPVELKTANAMLARQLREYETPLTLSIHQRLLPPGQGVGLARKIGCDVAAALIANGQVQDEMIRTTDADVEVPKNYFDPLPPGHTCLYG